MTKKHVAVVGATGAVGRTMMSILDERDFPVERLRVMASKRSAGIDHRRLAGVTSRWKTWRRPTLRVSRSLSSRPAASRSKEFAPKFAAAGATVVDNSSAFRMDDDRPARRGRGQRSCRRRNHVGIIANPNCTTMALMMGIGPLHRAAGLRTMTRLLVPERVRFGNGRDG